VEYSDCVQVLVDVLRDALDLSIKLVFNLEKIVLVTLGDEVDGNTKMAESATSSDSVKVGLCILWEVKVEHNIHRLDIDTSSENVGTHEDTSFTVLEVVENPKE